MVNRTPQILCTVEEVREKGPMRTIGHVTSSYFSPTLGHSIALGLVEDGLSRAGEWLSLPDEGRVLRAQIVDPVFYDKAGERNV